MGSVGAVVRPSGSTPTAPVVPRPHNDDSVHYENGPNIFLLSWDGATRRFALTRAEGVACRHTRSVR